MVCKPDFNDLRYLNEVGWFLYREKYGYNHYTDSYAKECLVWSQMLLDEVLGLCGRDRKWVEEKAVVTVACGYQDRRRSTSLRLPETGYVDRRCAQHQSHHIFVRRCGRYAVAG